VASYFNHHGWLPGEPVVSIATVSGDQVEQGLSAGLDPQMNIDELRGLGWSSSAALDGEMSVTAFRLEGAEGDEYWLGLPNFFVITRYNRSVMYAMAVNQLAELLVDARGVN
jgi:membrane-bound lytic murein transglycosylase B